MSLPTDKIAVYLWDGYNQPHPLVNVRPVVSINGVYKTGEIGVTDASGRVDFEAPCESDVRVYGYCVGYVEYAHLNTADFLTPSQVQVWPTLCNAFALEPASLTGLMIFHNRVGPHNPVLHGHGITFVEPSLIADVYVEAGVEVYTGAPRMLAYVRGHHSPGFKAIIAVAGITAGTANAVRFTVTDQNGNNFPQYATLTPPLTGLDNYWIAGCWHQDTWTFIPINIFMNTVPAPFDLINAYC